MAENEELVLTVRLDDQASAKIAGLQEQLKQMGTGAQAAGAERNRRQTRESSEGAAQLSREMRGLAVTAGVVGGVVGAVASKVTDLGMSFLARVTDLKGYSAEMLKLQQASYTAGTSTAQFQANIDAFAKSGIDAATAGRNIQGLSETLADLSRVNSQTRRELMRGLRPGEVSDMRQFIDDIVTSDPAEAFNKIKDFGEDIRKYQTELYGPEAGARAEQRFYEAMGVPDAGRFRGRLAPVTEEQKKLFKDREDASNKFYTSSVQIETAWNRSAQSIVAVGLHLLPISAGMTTVAEMSDRVVLSLQSWEREFRKTDGSFESLLRVTDDWGRGLDNWVGRQITGIIAGLRTTKAEFDAIYRGLQAIGVLEDEPPKPGSRAALRAEQMRIFKEQEAKKDQENAAAQAKADAERKAQEDLAKQPPQTVLETVDPFSPSNIAREKEQRAKEEKDRIDALRWRGRTRGRTVPPVEETSPVTVAPMDLTPMALPVPGPAAPPTPTGPVQPPPPQAAIPAIPAPIVPPRGSVPSVAQPAPPIQPVQIVPVETQPPTAPPIQPVQTQPVQTRPVIETQPAPPAPTKPGWFDWMLGRQPQQPPQQPQQQPQARIATDSLKSLSDSFQSAIKPVTPAAPAPPIIVPPTAPVTESNVDVMNFIRQNLKTEMLPPEQKPASPAIILPPRQSEETPTPQREPIAFNPDQPTPSAFDAGGRTIDLAGTGNPNQAAAEKLQTQSWLDTAAGAGAAIDRAAQRDVNVNGTGKISVDVRAPSGTNVRAQGEGLFRKTEISRQVQMEPAMSGPSYPAGAIAEG